MQHIAHKTHLDLIVGQQFANVLQDINKLASIHLFVVEISVHQILPYSMKCVFVMHQIQHLMLLLLNILQLHNQHGVMVYAQHIQNQIPLITIFVLV